jgi:pilus assembly protein CpaF
MAKNTDAWAMNSSVLAPLEAVGPKLAGLLAMPGVTDLLVNGWGQVWAQRSGHGSGLEQMQTPFESEAELGQLAQRLIGLGGRHLDQANPFADVSIGGLRVHAALASGCNSETLLSIRVHLNR